MLQTTRRDGLSIISAPGLQAECGVTVAFTDRVGGAGAPPFESLNLSFNVGDDHTVVLENRLEVAGALGFPLARWVLGRQVHGVGVSSVGSLEAARGAFDQASAMPGTDALVTAEEGLLVGVLVADCLPVLMVAPAGRCVAAVHAGWRGVARGIAPRALLALAGRAGCRPADVRVFVGPHIRSCCMQVDDSLAVEFARRFGEGCLVRGEAGVRLDLERACLSALYGLGVDEDNVESAGECTVCGEAYFSHRRDGGTTGRQAGFVGIVR
ncbi:MAG: polyphenol oxidase family protein [Actinobacteria bacterium]|nr:polyphenol oxidase family protein [Actinomycetota bacterium]MBU1942839.1 polyphenol oxidase family protein [Actinomycetota bacterium]MBU2687571.1 polyphenol oxidase family protein [Actinomycetota bacterium]